MLIIFGINDDATAVVIEKGSQEFKGIPHNGSHCGMEQIIQKLGNWR
jgi:hypothetical protein